MAEIQRCWVPKFFDVLIFHAAIVLGPFRVNSCPFDILNEHWLFDETTDTLAPLEHAHRCGAFFVGEPYFWFTSK